MKLWIKHYICFVIIVAATTCWALVDAVCAQASGGWINENYSCEDLEIKRGIVYSTRHGRVHSCVFSGKIVSTSIDEQQNVSITFHAFNVFNEQLWESTVHIQSLPPLGSHKFSNKISCTAKDPYRWKIEVNEPPRPPGD